MALECSVDVGELFPLRANWEMEHTGTRQALVGSPLNSIFHQPKGVQPPRSRSRFNFPKLGMFKANGWLVRFILAAAYDVK